MDGEAMLLGIDGVSDFNGLHSRKHDDEVQLILTSDGEDVRKLPLNMRKASLSRLLARRVDGIKGSANRLLISEKRHSPISGRVWDPLFMPQTAA
jgi:ATP-dependent DNA ligase